MTDVFGVSGPDLLGVVSAMAGAPVVRFTVEERHGVGDNYGTCGEKRVPTFVYEAAEGARGEVTAFVKRLDWAGRSEAALYRHLSAHGVPVPRLYGAFVDGERREVLFLERLPRIGFDRWDEGEWRAMLKALARLNACPPPIGGDARHLHPFEWGGALDGGLWVTGLTPAVDPDALERALAAAGGAETEREAMVRRGAALGEEVATLPLGLVHQDFMADNFGWRDGPAGPEFVVFDLHKVGLGARFADIAPYLGEPDWSPNRDWLDTDDRRERLIAHYLAEYAAAGGPVVAPERFRAEAGLLSRTHKVAVLGWLVTKPEASGRVAEVLEILGEGAAGGVV